LPTSPPSPPSRCCAALGGVYAKRPFAGPQAVLAHLARYTDRVAISNTRQIALDTAGVTFKWKDYRTKGRDPLGTMTLVAAQLFRRFLLHVLPSGIDQPKSCRPARRPGHQGLEGLGGLVRR
jgi:hypothetical protein